MAKSKISWSEDAKAVWGANDIKPMVYFAHDKIGRRVKIGFSKMPLVRIMDVSSKVGRELTILALIPSDISLERYFHKKYRDISLGHEWFKDERFKLPEGFSP